MTPADPPPPIDPGPTSPPRRQFHLKDFAWLILVVAVLCTFFRDAIRRDPWGMARGSLMGIVPLLIAYLVMAGGRAASAGLIAWGEGRRDRVGRIAARVGDDLRWLVVVCLLIGWVALAPGVDQWLKGRGW